MSEPTPPHSHESHDPPAVAYADPALPGGQPKFLRLGGMLGVAACAVGLAVLLLACGGFNAALSLAFIPLLLGLVGFVLALVGANREKHLIREDTHVLAALFPTCLGIIGGLVEMAARFGWQTFR